MRPPPPPVIPNSQRRRGAIPAARAFVAAAALLQATATAMAANPFAAEIIDAQGPFGADPYDDPSAVLGMPATDFYDPLAQWSGGSPLRRASLVEAVHHRAPDSSKLLVTLLEGSSIVARFEEPIRDDPAHPYGVDLLVFGNAFFPASGWINNATDLNRIRITGGAFVERIKVSVSPGYTGKPGQDPSDPATWEWYRYEQGPFGDSAFPTQSRLWDRATGTLSDELADFTKPVNPALLSVFNSAASSMITAADGLDLYDGAGGGTGFDLAESGFAEIQCVRVEGLPGFDAAEIDAFSAVRPMVLGDSLTIAPDNASESGRTLRFLTPDPATGPTLSLRFNTIQGIGRVATAPATNLLDSLPPGKRVLAAANLQAAALRPSEDILFTADIRWSPGQEYVGQGADLEVFSWNEESGWTRAHGGFDPASGEFVVAGVTRLEPMALLQIMAPPLAVTREGDATRVEFTPMPGWRHTLERSTDLAAWSEVATETPSESAPVVWTDPHAPSNSAFYRLRLAPP